MGVAFERRSTRMKNRFPLGLASRLFSCFAFVPKAVADHRSAVSGLFVAQIRSRHREDLRWASPIAISGLLCALVLVITVRA